MDTQYLAELNLQHWSVGMQRALAFRDAQGHDARFYDIDFRAMHDDPIAEVRGLYRWLGEPVSEEFENGMARWWQHNADTRESSAVRREAIAYNIDEGRMRTLFADYTQRMRTKVCTGPTGPVVASRGAVHSTTTAVVSLKHAPTLCTPCGWRSGGGGRSLAFAEAKSTTTSTSGCNEDETRAAPRSDASTFVMLCIASATPGSKSTGTQASELAS